MMTPVKDVMNDIMMLVEKRRTMSRWSVPVLHPFPMERPPPPRSTLLYMIKGPSSTTNRRIMTEPIMTTTSLTNLRLIRSPVEKHDSKWGMYIFPTAEPIVKVVAPVLRPIRRRRPSKVSLYAFPSLTTLPPKKTHSQLRLIRQSLREL